jgi:hypothetical protein
VAENRSVSLGEFRDAFDPQSVPNLRGKVSRRIVDGAAPFVAANERSSYCRPACGKVERTARMRSFGSPVRAPL